MSGLATLNLKAADPLSTTSRQMDRCPAERPHVAERRRSASLQFLANHGPWAKDHLPAQTKTIECPRPKEFPWKTSAM